jgi:hypothetical protein
MPAFRGNRVFRPQGQTQRNNWGGDARRLIEQGGRVYRNRQGDMHIVSAGGSHWGTIKNQPNMFEGGNLSKYQPEEDSEDITESFYDNNGR